MNSYWGVNHGEEISKFAFPKPGVRLQKVGAGLAQAGRNVRAAGYYQAGKMGMSAPTAKKVGFGAAGLGTAGAGAAAAQPFKPKKQRF